MIAVETNLLSKSFDQSITALDGLSIAIPEGAVFALLGPNGSGKTTTIRLLNGILSPSSGEARIFGLKPGDNISQVHAMCGVMTETAQAYEGMNAEENLEFIGRIYGLSSAEIQEKTRRWLSFFELEDARSRPVKTFSTGMKKRLQLAMAILHRPRLLFLDEPTSGLDPEAARNVNLLVKRLSEEEKTTVFLCTHQLRYAEDICTLYGFMSLGKLIGFGTARELSAQKEHAITLNLRTSGIPPQWACQRDDNGWMKIPIKDDAEAGQKIRELVSTGIEIFEARQEHMNLEDLYFAFQEGHRKENHHQ
ncbi:MAG: ABC transporter ATP-binding protein [Candidatus Ozemobacteraceae bacterium]